MFIDQRLNGLFPKAHIHNIHFGRNFEWNSRTNRNLNGPFRSFYFCDTACQNFSLKLQLYKEFTQKCQIWPFIPIPFFLRIEWQQACRNAMMHGAHIVWRCVLQVKPLIVRDGHQWHFVVRIEKDSQVGEGEKSVKSGDGTVHEAVHHGEVVDCVEVLEFDGILMFFSKFLAIFLTNMSN